MSMIAAPRSRYIIISAHGSRMRNIDQRAIGFQEVLGAQRPDMACLGSFVFEEDFDKVYRFVLEEVPKLGINAIYATNGCVAVVGRAVAENGIGAGIRIVGHDLTRRSCAICIAEISTLPSVRNRKIRAISLYRKFVANCWPGKKWKIIIRASALLFPKTSRFPELHSKEKRVRPHWRKRVGRIADGELTWGKGDILALAGASPIDIRIAGVQREDRRVFVCRLRVRPPAFGGDMRLCFGGKNATIARARVSVSFRGRIHGVGALFWPCGADAAPRFDRSGRRGAFAGRHFAPCTAFAAVVDGFPLPRGGSPTRILRSNP